jgi:hypothetical protein
VVTGKFNRQIVCPKITPELIPHQQFHKGIWLLSVNRPQWYYFMQTKQRHPIMNEHFLESVDPPLKELVNFLHHSGIETTPSCAGHHKGVKEFEKIYEALQEDKKEIKSNGLQLKDIESGKIYLYRNKHYELPWNKEVFLNKVLKYQENGIVGIRAPENVKDKMLHIYIPGVKIREKDSIVFIETIEHSLLGVWKKWKKITREIKGVLQRF